MALADLAAQPFVLATGGCSVNAGSVAEQAGLALCDVRATVTEWSSAFALVREGVGVTLAPELTLPENRRGLRVLPLTRRCAAVRAGRVAGGGGHAGGAGIVRHIAGA